LFTRICCSVADRHNLETVYKRLSWIRGDRIYARTGSALLHIVIKQSQKGYCLSSGVIQAFSCHMDVNVKDSRGYTPLHRAAYLGNKGAVQEMLEHDHIQVNSFLFAWNTPPHYTI